MSADCSLQVVETSSMTLFGRLTDGALCGATRSRFLVSRCKPPISTLPKYGGAKPREDDQRPTTGVVVAGSGCWRTRSWWRKARTSASPTRVRSESRRVASQKTKTGSIMQSLLPYCAKRNQFSENEFLVGTTTLPSAGG